MGLNQASCRLAAMFPYWLPSLEVMTDASLLVDTVDPGEEPRSDAHPDAAAQAAQVALQAEASPSPTASVSGAVCMCQGCFMFSITSRKIC